MEPTDFTLFSTARLFFGPSFQRHLADRLGVHRSFLHAVEVGRRNLPPARRAEIERLLRSVARVPAALEEPGA